MKDLAIHFGKKLRNVRTSRNISQENLAFFAKIDRSYLGRIERGEVNVTLEKTYALAEALECPLSELLPNMKGNIID